MKRNRIHKILAIWLLGVFVLNITPREFIHHLFADHEDTRDTLVDGVSVSPVHQHCGFLNIGVPPYDDIISIAYHPLVVAVDWHYIIVPPVACHDAAPVFAALRGPPATFA